MRCIVLVKATRDSEAGVMPTQEMLEAMGKYNDELIKAGIMLAGEGLHPSAKGKRVRFAGAARTVIDGPFAETKELVAGFWLWQVKSMEEAIEWLKRAPTRCPASPKSKSARYSRPRTLAPNSRPNCGNRRRANVRGPSSSVRVHDGESF